jgi:addiction module HigA family antidote
LAIFRGCDFSTVPGLMRCYYRMNPCEGNSATLRLNLVNLYGVVGFTASVRPTATRLLWFHPSSTQLKTSRKWISQRHLHALKGDRSLKEAAMRMKKPAHPGELVAASLKELGLSVVEAAKAIGVIRQQLYNVINGRSEVTPEMAVRVEKAFGGSAVWLRMQADHDLGKARQKQREDHRAPSHARPV